MSSINFVSENTLDEKRKKRQEEWEKVRNAEDPVEAPEDPVDNRTLYDRLQEQKMKKEAEKEEEHKLRNMVQGLKKDETDFLDFVANKQMEHDRQRDLEEKKLLAEVQEARGKLPPVSEPSDAVSAPSGGQSDKSSSSKSSQVGASKRTTQSALLAGVVKRKRPSSSGGADDDGGGGDDKGDKGSGGGGANDAPVAPRETKDRVGNGVARVIGVLPGIGEYTDSSNSDSDDDKIETKHLSFMKAKKKNKESHAS